MKGEQGFTVVEVVVAVLILTVGVLALAGGAALATRMIGRGQRAGAMTMYAAQRLEQLRTTACTSQAAGSDTLWRGATAVDVHSWRFVQPGPNHWRIVLTANWLTQGNAWRTDSVETEVSCLR
jgi:Tfp pilus assembly protein PilV